MRVSYFVLVVAYIVIDLGCVFTCIFDINNNLEKEHFAVCRVGQKYARNCIQCECVKKDRVICTKVCGKLSRKETKLCFRPKLEKLMTQKLSINNVVENGYEELADLAKDCKQGDRVEAKCQCCYCECITPGIVKCKQLIGCDDKYRFQNRTTISNLNNDSFE
ncbi:uncharacterized protein [Choristoneura fumiferana]|uniref:uncharacterized protein n=1 Tax=Choristoneura fumiferana TaxID=7141 RepID=UPI003D159CFC